MSKYFLALQKVHDFVHDFQLFEAKITTMKKKFSEPKIYTGGVNIKDWNKLKRKEQEEALSKEWYVYYSFRQEDGNLKRMPNVKAGANSFKTKKERYNYLKVIQSQLLQLLELGLNPYEDNDLTVLQKNNEPRIIHKEEVLKQSNSKEQVVLESNKVEQTNVMTIKEALEFGLRLKENVININSYKNLKNRIKKFSKFFDNSLPITSIDKKSVMEYLNHVLIENSARTRNNHRTDLSSMFQVLEDNDIIANNFIKKISVLKTKAEKNKTYTSTQEKDIFEYLESNDPLLLLYIKFISYNFLRPVEVNRLRIRDIDLVDRKIYVKTKTKALKVKIIPEILVQELPNLSELNQEHYLFTPNGLGLEWNADEINRRDNFSKRFKTVVKDHFKLGSEYGLYSFRHTFITKLYRKLREEKTPFEVKSYLMNITGHTTMDALEKYLRDIDAELPEDYSSLFKNG